MLLFCFVLLFWVFLLFLFFVFFLFVCCWFFWGFFLFCNTDVTFNVTALSIKLSGDDHPLPGPDSGSSKIIPVRITNRNDSYRPNNQLRSYTKSNTFRQKRFVPRNYITIKPQAAEGPPKRGNQNTAVRGQHHCIKVYHLNVRSIKNRENFKQVRELINPAATHSDFDVFTISESWLD